MDEGYPRRTAGMRPTPPHGGRPTVEFVETVAFEEEIPMAVIAADFDVETLLSEIERYLAAVDAFREEGHEPLWVQEPLWSAV